jgi:hypothetical protein
MTSLSQLSRHLLVSSCWILGPPVKHSLHQREFFITGFDLVLVTKPPIIVASGNTQQATLIADTHDEGPAMKFD